MHHPAADQTSEQRARARRPAQPTDAGARYPRPIGEPAGSRPPRGDLDAAQRSAEAIRAAAEERARRTLDQAQRQADRLTAERVRALARISDELIEQAAAVRRRSDELLAALDRAIAAAAVPSGESGPGPAAAAAEPLAGGQSAPAPGTQRPTAPSPTPPGSAPSAALRRATELAMGGRGRSEIAAVLRDEHGVEPGPLLDRVFGPGR